MNPPFAKTIPKKLEIHNHVRIDDYYWLNERENPEVMKYLKQENEYYDNYFKPINSLRENILEEMKSKIKKDDNSVPYTLGEYEYFYRYNNEQQYPVYCRKKKNEGQEQIILDVNEIAKDKDYCSVVNVQPSPNHKYISYSLDLKGRRIYNIRFRDLETGKDLDDSIEQVTSNHCWANDNVTIFYTSKDLQTLRSDKIHRHKLGQSKETDVLVFEEKDDTFSCYVTKSLSNRYISIRSSHTDRTEVRMLDANTPEGEFKIFLEREGKHEYGVRDGVDRFYIITNDGDNKNFKLVEAPLKIPTNKSEWKDVVPHREDVLVESVTVLKDWIVIDERKNALLSLRCINRSNNESHSIAFDEEVYEAGSSYISEYDTLLYRYTYQSLTTPTSTYQYNLATREKTLLKQKEVMGGFDKNNYVTKRIWVPAYTDQTLIPISLVYRKETVPSKDTPLFLYGYGSYGISIDPYFSSNRLSLLDRGFIFVIAHIRGGEEMGRKWYEDGKLMKKMNTFTDFISCAQYLVDNNFTSPQKLFVSGGSAGGLLIGAVINMRPDLFCGAILDVPFVDVVTTMLDDTIPLTTGEYTEWGNPNEKEAYYYMLSYSPYDNVIPQNYPNLFFLTGFEDSQVQYFEPAKLVSKLRRVKTDNNILLFKTDLSSGHSGATGRFKELEDVAIKFSFVLNLAGKDSSKL